MHAPSPEPMQSDEDGSLVTEYGLLAVVAATVAGVLIQWATGGAVVNLFNALVDRARELVGA
jgi:Flp pilus assembly pilin Flp